jgi:8-oxo-dGTP pyrophosphatase MutT (NUDIX family)
MTDTQKRIIAGFLPYRKTDGSFEFYLQRRGEHARILPGKLGLFGGGREGEETLEETLARELREELSYTPKQVTLLARYESPYDIVTVFTEEVGSDFETLVTIGEGEYGRFYGFDDVLRMDDVSKLVQLAVEQFGKHQGIIR